MDNDQPVVSPYHAITLKPGQTVGQTFVAQHGGLSGVELWLEPSPDAEGILTLRLREDFNVLTDLAVVTASIRSGSLPGFYRFSWIADIWSHTAYRYIALSYDGRGAVIVGAASGEQYIDGSAYLDHRPQPSHQLAFRLVYGQLEMLAELITASAKGTWMLLIAVLAYLLPGYGLLVLIHPPGNFFWPARVGLAIGLSFALYPLLMLWSHAIGLSLGSLNAWLPIGVGVVLTIVRLSRLRAGMFRERFRLWICADGFLADVVFIMAIPFLLVTRFLPIRSLPAPMWGDSYQHAVVTQLVIDNGGLFHTWQPYADYSSFTVHYGFSAISAVFAWLTGCDSVSSSLVVGQLANTAAVISVYSLANALFPGSRWVGTLAVIAAGMLSKMPMYYVNWGRYAQLSAQVILPPVLSLLLTQTRLKYPSGKLNLITSICIAGSMLHYYRAPFYLIAFAVALLVLDMFRSGLRKETVLRETVNLLTSGCFAAILTYPRFHASMDSRLSESAGAVISADYELLWKSVVEDYNVWSNVSWFVHPSLLVLSALSIPISLLSKKWRASVGVVATWSVILFLLPMGRLFRIPGLNLMQSFANAIFIYVPVSTLTAMTIDYLLGRCQSYLKKQAVLAFAFLVLILGVPLQIGFVDPKNHALVTHPDVRAMRWIRDYTDSDSVFLVEGFSIYSGSSIVGSDAGWWIPLIARRKNTIPPQYAILNERESEKGLTKSLINLVLTAETSGIQSSQFRLSACRLGVSYLYVGQRQGLVGADVRQMFSYQEARQIGRVVYERDRVLLVSLEDCP